MFKRTVLILLILSLVTTLFAVDELWRKAQQIADNSWRIVHTDFTMTFDIDVTRKKETFSVTTAFKARLNDDLTYTYEDITATIKEQNIEEADEETLTQEKLDAMTQMLAEQLQADHMVAKFEPPKREGIFFETNPKNLRVSRLNETQNIDGKQCAAYSIWYTDTGKRNDRVEGKMWIDMRTGAPVFADLNMPKTPMFVKKITILTSYTYDEDEEVYYETKTESLSEVSMMGVRLNMNMSMTYDDYMVWEQDL